VNEELGSLHAHGDWAPAMDTVSGHDVLNDVIRTAHDSIGARLQAAYALGSLAHGGFSPLVSDVDLALILADPIRSTDDELLLSTAQKARSQGSSLHSRVSIFWGTSDSLAGRVAGGRFPPLDRLCLLEHGRLLTGLDVRAGLPRPTRTELVVSGAQFALDALAEDLLAHAHQPEQLVAAGVRWTTKIVLFPVRFLFTADTGAEGTNDAATEHYVAQHGAPGAGLVGAALNWRTEPSAPEDAVTMLGSDLVPLYEHYLTDHIGRLESFGYSELAQAFRDWRSRLLTA
jgi:hypothetical protein